MKDSIRRRLERVAERCDELRRLLAEPDVADKPDRFRELSVEYSRLEPVAADFAAWLELERQLEAARGMASDPDPQVRELAAAEVGDLEARLAEAGSALQWSLVPPDPNDDSNVFLEVRAAAGGDEAAIFAGDLFRMYSRYADAKGWRIELLSENRGEHGGYREVISRIVGRGAYAKLKFESGTHRVQRVPATEAQGRIHTSTCTVAILPEAEEVASVEVSPGDLRVDTYRASGAGGQHVNRTDSAVRITHLPTNIVVQCQNDRSQHRNRATAMKMLKARLYELELQRREEEAQAEHAAKTDIGWGHQIRSYVLHPYKMVKDLRTNVEKGNADAVLDGGIDDFLEAALAARVGSGAEATEAL